MELFNIKLNNSISLVVVEAGSNYQAYRVTPAARVALPQADQLLDTAYDAIDAYLDFYNGKISKVYGSKEHIAQNKQYAKIS